MGTYNRSIWYFGFVQMPDPRDIFWFQIPAPAGMKAGQMPGGGNV